MVFGYILYNFSILKRECVYGQLIYVSISIVNVAIKKEILTGAKCSILKKHWLLLLALLKTSFLEPFPLGRWHFDSWGWT
jgi:hypothetical protein